MGPNRTPGVNLTAPVIIYVLWYSCDTFTINKQLSPMSLCFAREGNFCAKLTWCPLAGRWRLVSGWDLHHLHQSVCYTSISSTYHAIQLSGQLRNTIIPSLREERRVVERERERVRDQFLHFSCFSLLTDGVVQQRTSPSNGKLLPSITTEPNSLHLSLLSWDHTLKKII